MLEKPELLITHDGQFHADEVFTIALIRKYAGLVPIERRRTVSREDMGNPRIWVLDQYGEYDLTKHNFDHHQDRNLSATNVLVLDYLKDQEVISEDLWMLLRRPFNGISDYDTKGPVPFNGFQVNEFFKVLNNLDNGFEIALGIAKIWLDGVEALISKKEQALKFFTNGRSIDGIIRVCKEFPILWSSMGTEKLLVAPEKGQWRLHSSDTENYPIVTTGKEIFLHTNKFIASYLTKDDAIEAAKITARLIASTPLM